MNGHDVIAKRKRRRFLELAAFFPFVPMPVFAAPPVRIDAYKSRPPGLMPHRVSKDTRWKGMCRPRTF